MAKPKLATLDRFMMHVYPEPNSGCWLWDGAENEGGYGLFYIWGAKKRANKAHRFSYESFIGPSPPVCK